MVSGRPRKAAGREGAPACASSRYLRRGSVSLSEESLFREVDEEIRREQLKALWDRFGTYIVAACVAVILGVAAFKGWQYWQHRQALEAGQAYLAAVQLAEQGNAEAASAAFAKLAESGDSGYATLARLQEAAFLASNGETDKAVAIFDEVAAQERTTPVLASLARVRAGLLLVDSAPVEELRKRVGDLDVEGNPWRNEAREVLALGAYRASDLETADKLFNEILADPRAPFGLRQRAQIMLALIAPKIGGQGAGASGEETASDEDAAAGDAASQ